MQVGPSPTMQRVACEPNPGFAYSPRADPAQVTRLVGQEDVCATVLALEPPLEPSSGCRQRGEIGAAADEDEQVDIFRVGAVGEQRANQRDPLNAGQSGG